jgi:3',5'-cyclic-AMP phosphodiesterase
VVRRHPQVVAVLCGHAHTAGSTTFGGVPLLVAPGVVSTLTFPWERGADLDYGQPPAIAFHVLDGGRLTTHFVP